MNGQTDDDKIMWNVPLRGKVCSKVTVGMPCAGQYLPSAQQYFLVLSECMFMVLKTQCESNESVGVRSIYTFPSLRKQVHYK